MSVDRKLLISVLKLTQNMSSEHKAIKRDAGIPLSVCSFLLQKLQTEKLIYLQDSVVKTDSESRVKMAVKAAGLGADVEQVSGFLRWQEFEEIAAYALQGNGYVTSKNVRFKHEGKRWEIDVVGCKKPLVVCVDCKRWHHGMHLSALAKIVKAQSERVAALAESLPTSKLDLACTKWGRAKLVPVVVSLIRVSSKFCEGVPIVPVLQLQDFISQLPLQLDSVAYFSRQFAHL